MAMKRLWIQSISSKTQPYEPSFDLYKITKTVTVKDGESTTEQTETLLELNTKLTTPSGEGETKEAADGSKVTAATTYEIRFSGKKGVRNAAGSLVDGGVDINQPENSTEATTNVNYTVITDEDTLKKNVQNAEVINSTALTINTEKIVEAFMAGNEQAKRDNDDKNVNIGDKDKDIAVASKTYDGNRIFENRAAYKLAEVVDKDGAAVAQGTDSKLTYSWYKLTQVDESCKDSAGDVDPVKLQAYLAKQEQNSAGYYKNFFKYVGSYDINRRPIYEWTNPGVISPKDAGVYKLQITYNDPTAETHADTAFVCFVINKQQVSIVFDEDKSYEEYSGIKAEEFFKDKELFYSVKPQLTTPLSGEELKEQCALKGTANEYELEWSDNYYYSLKFKLQKKKEQQAAEGNNEADGAGSSEPEYEDVNALDALEKDAEYRIAVDKFTLFNDYGDYGELSKNYTTEETTLLVKKAETESEEDTAENEYSTETKPLSTDTVPLKVNSMGETELTFGDIEPITVEKTYDKVPVSEYKAESEDETFAEKIKAIQPYKTASADTNKEYVNVEDLSEGLEIEWRYYPDPDDDYDYWQVTEIDTENAGKYEVYLSFRGNADYAPIGKTLVAEALVKQRELVIRPAELENEVTAGTKVGGLYEELKDNLIIEGDIVPEDQPAFEYRLICTWHGEYADAPEHEYTANCEYTTDRLAFLDRYNEVVDYPKFVLTDSEGETYTVSDSDNADIIKGDETYEVSIDDSEEVKLTNFDYSVNYTLKVGKPVSFTTVRGSSEFASGLSNYDSNNVSAKVDAVNAKDNIVRDEQSGEYTHTLSVVDGIKYTECTVYGEKICGNMLVVKVTQPEEYTAAHIKKFENTDPSVNAVYENSIKKMPGYVYHWTWGVSGNDYQRGLSVILDASKGAQSFDITWEKGYTEHFNVNFDNAKLLGDLRDAVAPKSISFNSPVKKMAVGEEQQLDLKITKTLMEDVICIAYKTDKEGILSINEYGKVTALKKGTVKVTAYPVTIENGVKTPIPRAKSASVTIKVTDVTAPKVTKALGSDTYGYFEYSKVEDGYRREIFVLAGKKRKESDFTTAIAQWEASNEKWQGIFAAAPKFVDKETEDDNVVRVYNKKTKKYEDTNKIEAFVYGLQPGAEYTVYIRNVSALRTLSDGSRVEESVAGSASSFTTSKPQVKYLESALASYVPDTEVICDPLACQSYHNKKANEYYDEVCKNVRQIYDPEEYDFDTDRLHYVSYHVPLSAGKVTVAVDGAFAQNVNYPAADRNDYYKLMLPFKTTTDKGNGAALDKSAKNKYLEPKLEYRLFAYVYGSGYDDIRKEYVEDGYYYDILTDKKIASINKKGVITLKQPAQIAVYAVDTISGKESNVVVINVTAAADSVKNKTTSLQVGQAVPLEALLTYKSGKTTLAPESNFNKKIEVTEALKSQIEAGGYFRLYGDGYVMAVKAKGNIRLSLTDKYLGQSAQAIIKSTDLQPVKNLKTKEVIDNKLTITFDRNIYAKAYRITVMNGRGSIIRSSYVKNNYDTVYDADNGYGETPYYFDYLYDSKDKNFKIICDHDDYDYGYGHLYFMDNKKLKDTCEYTIDGLTQQSSYKISVEAVFDDAASPVVSKAASKSVKTTKLPASEIDYLDDYEEDDDYGYGDGYGGCDINILSMNKTLGDGYSYRASLISGNTYSLKLLADNKGADVAFTDKLTWSVSNKKTASVKATPGTYSAQFKALRAGETVLEVKSGITKHVIARYKFIILPVGDAYSPGSRYYGDNEDLRGKGTNYDPLANSELILNKPAAVDLVSGNFKIFTFTAPKDGTYAFYALENGVIKTDDDDYFGLYNNELCDSSYGGSVDRTDDGVRVKLNKDQTVYIKVDAKGQYTMNVRLISVDNEKMVIKVGEEVDSADYGQIFVFTADEKAIYKFSGALTVYSGRDMNNEQKLVSNNSYDSAWVSLDKDQTVYIKSDTSYNNIKVEKQQVEAITLGSEGEIELTAQGRYVWYSYTPAEDATYEISVKEASSNFNSLSVYSADNTKGLNDDNALAVISYGSDSESFSLGKGETVYIKVYNNNDNDYTLFNIKKTNSIASFQTTPPTEGQEVGETSGTVSASEAAYVYLRYDVPEDGIYTFKSVADETSGIKAGNLSAKLIKDRINSSAIEESTSSDENVSIFMSTYLKKGNVVFVGVKQGGSASYNMASYGVGVFGSLLNDTVDAGAEAPNVKLIIEHTKVDDIAQAAPETEGGEGVEAADPKAELELPANEAKYIAFTVKKDVNYIFKLKSGNSALFSGEMYEDLTTGKITLSTDGNVSSKTIGYVAKADGKVYWKIKNADDSADTDNQVSITMSENKVNEFVPDQTGGAYEGVVYPGIDTWISFKAPDTATGSVSYEFAFSTYSTYGNSINAEMYNAYKPSQSNRTAKVSGYFTSSSRNFTVDGKFNISTPTLQLSPGQTVYWKLHSDSDYISDEQSFTVKVKAVGDMELKLPQKTEEGEEDNTVSADVFAGTEQWFKFTAVEDGRYTFTFENSVYYNISLEGHKGSKDAYADPSNESFSAYSDKTIEVNLSSGTDMYWRVKNDNEDDAKVSVKVAVVSMNEMKDAYEFIELAKGDNLFKYNVQETGRYTVIYMCSDNCTGDSRSLELYDGIDALDNNESIKGCEASGNKTLIDGTNYLHIAEDIWLTSGHTLFGKVSNSKGYSGNTYKAAVRITKVTATELTDGIASEIEIKNNNVGESKWFSYTANEAGKYAFNILFTDDEGNTIQSSESIYIYDSLESEESSDIINYSYSDNTYTYYKDIYMKSGETKYIKLMPVAYSDIYNVTKVSVEVTPLGVKKLTISGDSSETESNKFTLSNGTVTTQLFSFTADESARYVFNFTSSKEDSYVKIHLSDSLDEGENDENSSYLDLVSVGENHVGSDSVYIEKGKKVYCSVESTSSDTVTGSIKVSEITEDKIEEISEAASEEDTAKSYAIPRGNEKWFKFTNNTENDILYAFTVSAGLVSLYNNLSDNEKTEFLSSDNSSKTYQCRVNVGDTVYIRILNLSSSSDDTIKVNGNKLDVSDLTVGNEVLVNINGTAMEAWYSFTAAKTGIYNITLNRNDMREDDSYYKVGFYGYSSTGEYRSTSIDYGSPVVLTCAIIEGSSVSFKIQKISNSGLPPAYDFSGTLIVTERTGAEVSELALDKSAEVKIDASQEDCMRCKWLKFTAPSDGQYQFYSDTAPINSAQIKAWFFKKPVSVFYTGNNDKDLRPLNRNADDIANNDVYRVSFKKILDMKAGETVYIAVGQVQLYAGASSSIDTNVYVKNYSGPTELTLDKPVEVKLAIGEYVILSFTADKAGKYSFYSNRDSGADPCAWLFTDMPEAGGDAEKVSEFYDSVADNDNYQNSSNDFSISYDLAAGQTVYLVAASHKLEGAGEFTVNAEMLNE